MPKHTLKCRLSSADQATAEIDSDGDVRLEIGTGTSSWAHIYARPEAFADFARAVLGEAGRTLNGASMPVVGDDVWAAEVRKVNNTEPASLVDRAKQLLDGMSPTAADIVAMVGILRDAR